VCECAAGLMPLFLKGTFSRFADTNTGGELFVRRVDVGFLVGVVLDRLLFDSRELFAKLFGAADGFEEDLLEYSGEFVVELVVFGGLLR